MQGCPCPPAKAFPSGCWAFPGTEGPLAQGRGASVPRLTGPQTHTHAPAEAFCAGPGNPGPLCKLPLREARALEGICPGHERGHVCLESRVRGSVGAGTQGGLSLNTQHEPCLSIYFLHTHFNAQYFTLRKRIHTGFDTKLQDFCGIGE